MEGADIVNESRSTEEGNQEKSPTGDSSSSEFPTFVLKHRDIDRGWAWLAMCSSFFSEILLGLCFPMVGIMYVYQLETVGKGPVLTACIGSLMTSLLVMCGPVSTLVSRRYGRRLCMIAGGVIVCVSLAVSSQSYNFWLVFVTNGLLAAFVVTRTGNYDNAFYMTGVANFLAVICIIAMVLLRQGRTAKGVMSPANNDARGTDGKTIDNRKQTLI